MLLELHAPHEAQATTVGARLSPMGDKKRAEAPSLWDPDALLGYASSLGWHSQTGLCFPMRGRYAQSQI
jgi:hypothetical protein